MERVWNIGRIPVEYNSMLIHVTRHAALGGGGVAATNIRPRFAE
jgi:hypothetical protein